MPVQSKQCKALRAQIHGCPGEIYTVDLCPFLRILAQHVAVPTADVKYVPACELLIFMEFVGEPQALVAFPETIVILEILRRANGIRDPRSRDGVRFPKLPGVINEGRC